MPARQITNFEEIKYHDKHESKKSVVQFWMPVQGKPHKRGCSSVGRAPALQAGGQGFESLHLHHKGLKNGLIAQVVRACA